METEMAIMKMVTPPKMILHKQRIHLQIHLKKTQNNNITIKLKQRNMRKSIITALFAIATLVAGAQVDDALKQLGKNNDKAKEAIDKLTADPANAKNADVWYAKAQIYNAIATDDKLKASVPDAYDQAFEAFRKAFEIDPNN